MMLVNFEMALCQKSMPLMSGAEWRKSATSELPRLLLNSFKGRMQRILKFSDAKLDDDQTRVCLVPCRN